MASRRSRLKAVANLPVRKRQDKPESSEAVVKELKEDKKEDTVEVELSAPDNLPCENSSEDGLINNEKRKGPAKYNRLLRPAIPVPVRRHKTSMCEDSEKKTNSEQKLPEGKVVDKENNSNTIEQQVSNVVSEKEQSSVPNTNVNKDDSRTSENKFQCVESAVADTSIAREKFINPLFSPKQSQRSRFVRPSPRLLESSLRRTSVHVSSASESEDDNKRPHYPLSSLTRTRKNSESSISSRLSTVQSFSLKEQLESGVMDNLKSNVPILRRKQRSNIGRRLAEARREFNLKYDKNQPTRNTLTMFDLIFYNPGTNTMESSNVKVEKKEIKEEKITLLEEEIEDDPDMKDDESGDEDSDAERKPVPQVKIGPNGEIILDEKSLVIETTEAKKGREELKHSVPVYEDRNNSGGYYRKKSIRGTPWSDSETKWFYKALKTIGTDFLLMQTLFPNRSRIELKNKFKKEERCNKHLIDKALNFPVEFDLEELKKDLEEERREVNEKMTLKQEKNECSQKKQEPKRVKRQKRKAKKSCIGRDLASDEEDETDTNMNSTVELELKILENIKKEIEVDSLVQNAGRLPQVLLESTDLRSKRPKFDTNNSNHDRTDNTSANKSIAVSQEVTEKRKIIETPLEKKPPKRTRKIPNLVLRPKRGRKANRSETDFNLKQVQNEEFIQVLTNQVNSMNETTLRVQVTNDDQHGASKVELILENVPETTLSELGNTPHTVLASGSDIYQNTEIGLVSGGISAIDTPIDYTKEQHGTPKVVRNSLPLFDSSPAKNNSLSERKLTNEQVEKCMLVDHSYVSPRKKGTVIKNTADSYVVLSRKPSDRPDRGEFKMVMMTPDTSDGKVKYNTIPAYVPKELLDALTAEIDGSSSRKVVS